MDEGETIECITEKLCRIEIIGKRDRSIFPVIQGEILIKFW